MQKFLFALCSLIMVLLTACSPKQSTTTPSSSMKTPVLTMMTATEAQQLGILFTQRAQSTPEPAATNHPWLQAYLTDKGVPKPGSFHLGEPIHVQSALDLESIPEDTGILRGPSGRKVSKEDVQMALGDEYIFPIVLSSGSVGGYARVSGYKLDGQFSAIAITYFGAPRKILYSETLARAFFIRQMGIKNSDILRVYATGISLSPFLYSVGDPHWLFEVQGLSGVDSYLMSAGFPATLGIKGDYSKPIGVVAKIKNYKAAFNFESVMAFETHYRSLATNTKVISMQATLPSIESNIILELVK
jgi:hypothetical protein